MLVTTSWLTSTLNREVRVLRYYRWNHRSARSIAVATVVAIVIATVSVCHFLVSKNRQSQQLSTLITDTGLQSRKIEVLHPHSKTSNFLDSMAIAVGGLVFPHPNSDYRTWLIKSDPALALPSTAVYTPDQDQDWKSVLEGLRPLVTPKQWSALNSDMQTYQSSFWIDWTHSGKSIRGFAVRSRTSMYLYLKCASPP